MRNIICIIREDLRRLRLNSINLLIAIGLICLPSCYAWFNVGGSWDPYGNTSELPIGVVNRDAGYSNKYLPIDICMGDTVTASLYSNSSFKWEFVDYDTAMYSLTHGELYAVIEIPEDFSENIMSILSEKSTSASLIYYTDEKQNAIAPKITGKGADAIQHTVNKIFAETILNALFKTASNMLEVAQSETVTTLVQKLSTSFGDAATSMKGATVQLKNVQEMTGAIKDLLGQINDLLPESEPAAIERLQVVISKVNEKLEDAKSLMSQIADILEEAGVSPEAVQTLRELTDILTQVEQITSSTGNIAQSAYGNLDNMRDSMASYSALIDSLNTQLDNVCSDLEVLSGDMSSAKEALDGLQTSATLEDLQKVIGDNPTSFAHLVSSPMVVDRHKVFGMENNGSSMSGFYTSLSIWVGATLLVAIMKVEVSKRQVANINARNKRRAEKKGRKYKPVRDWQLYLGRYFLFACMAVLQSVMIALGEIYFLGIQCLHPDLYILTCALLGILFSLLIYTLTYCFGNIGKAAAVILLVLQISSSGGMFPAEMLAWPFSAVYEFLPLTYALECLNCCVAGFNSWEVVGIWFVLIIYIVPISLVMGLALRRFFKKGNEWFVAKMHETHLVV